MCLHLTKGNKPLIASEDITVYKYGMCRGDTFHPNFRTQFVYEELKVQPTVDLIITNYRDEYFIAEGYHSLPSLQVLKLLNSNSDVGVFIIPKGTPYYIGEFFGQECYCSASIIYMGKYRKPFSKLIIKFIKNFLK